MSHSHYFDFVIVGDGIGGLYAGLLLARAGARVAILGQVGNLPADEPFLTPVVRVRPLHGAPSLFHYLLEGGLAHEGTANLFATRQPGFQLLGREYRLDLTAGEESEAEFRRERPELVEHLGAMQEVLDRFGFDLDGLLADNPLPAKGFFEGRSVKKAFSRVERAVPEAVTQTDIGEMLRAVGLTSAISPLNSELGLSELRAASRWRDGDATLVGGRRGLARHLAALCTKHGAKVELDARVNELVLRGSKVEEVAHSAGQPYGCGALVFSRTADQLASLVPSDSKVRKKLDEYASQARPENLVVGVRLRLPSRAIPTPLRDRAVLTPSAPIAEGASMITIALDALKTGDRLLSAMVAIPGDELSSSVEKQVSARLLEALEDAIPFLRENAKEAGDGPETWIAHAYSFAEPGAIGVEGIDPETPLSNAWLVSRQVLPGLELEGEMLAGRRVASWLHKGAVQPKTGAIARALKRA